MLRPRVSRQSKVKSIPTYIIQAAVVHPSVRPFFFIYLLLLPSEVRSHRKSGIHTSMSDHSMSMSMSSCIDHPPLPPPLPIK